MFRHQLRKKLRKKQKGMALMMALFTILIVSFIASEITYESMYEYRLAMNEIDGLKAYYGAKNGVEMSLLRIQIYKQVKSQFGDKLPNASILDKIWSFPLAWPITPMDDDASMGTKEELKEINETTMQDSNWATQIQSEGNKIDLNDLVAPSQALAESYRKRLIEILQNKIDNDVDWASAHHELRPEEIVNNIIDYLDSDDEGRNGGPEANLYSDRKLEPDQKMPPNRYFRTLEELHSVAGVTDDIYEVLAPSVTVYGIKGVNVNYAGKELLLALDPMMNEEMVAEIIKRRDDPDQGPFKDEKDFLNFMGTLSGFDATHFNESKMPLRFDAEYNFRVSSSGNYGKMNHEIIAIAYDFSQAKKQLGKLVEDENKRLAEAAGVAPTPTPVATPNPDANAGGAGGGNAAGAADNSVDKGRPRVIYWKEN